MDMTANPLAQSDDIPEILITAGLRSHEVDPILDMAADSGVFSTDALVAAEDMAWDAVYGSDQNAHRFLKASVSDSSGNRIVGFICYGPIAHWNEDYELYGIAVDPEYRKLGIGSALMSKMKRQVGADGGMRIFLETGTGREFETACSFFKSNEFTPEHRHFRQFIPSQDAVAYSFRIQSDEADMQRQ